MKRLTFELGLTKENRWGDVFTVRNVLVQSVFIYVVSGYTNWNKRKFLPKKKVQLPQNWFGTPT